MVGQVKLFPSPDPVVSKTSLTDLLTLFGVGAVLIFQPCGLLAWDYGGRLKLDPPAGRVCGGAKLIFDIAPNTIAG